MNFNTNDYRILAADFISLNEAILDSATKHEILHAAQNDDNKACNIYLDKTGHVKIGYPSQDESITYATLFFSLKRLSMRGDALVANKITSGAQQLLTALYKSGIIDNTWKVEPGDKVSYYNAAGDYVKYKTAYADETLLFWINRKNRIYPFMTGLKKCS